MKYTLEYFQEIAKRKGGKLLSKEYLGIKKKLKFECADGHTFSGVAENIKGGSWCKECVNKKREIESKIAGLKRLQDFATSKRGKLLSGEYVDVYSKYIWECERKHTWEATPAIARSTWCKICPSIKKLHKYIGKKYKMLKVISIEGGNDKPWAISNVDANCDCDCGMSVTVKMKYLVSGETKSCGCLKRNNLIGTKIDKLTVLEECGSHKKRGIEYLCLCDCGNKTKKYSSYLMSAQKFNKDFSCGCHIKDRRTESILKERLRKYNAEARRRHIKFSLSDDQFYDLITKSCHYCGLGPQELMTKTTNKDKGTLAVNGIDRVDSSLPYEIDNVVPCCTFCNLAKLDWDKDFFFKKLEKIYEKWIINGKIKDMR